jgi:hypothetical protein
VIDADPLLLLVFASLLAKADAVLLTVPHVSGVVGETIWTVLLPPDATVPKLQVRVPELMLHCGLSGLSDQLNPTFAGNVSVTVTFFASPAPLFVTVITNPIASVELTDDESAVLLTTRSGQSTFTVAVEVLFVLSAAASFVAETFAVFVSGPQSAASVRPVTWKVLVAAELRSPKEQVRLFKEMEQSGLSSVQLTPAGNVSLRFTERAIPAPVLETIWGAQMSEKS